LKIGFKGGTLQRGDSKIKIIGQIVFWNLLTVLWNVLMWKHSIFRQYFISVTIL